MATEPLPPELISLVHHVELNKAGWWDKAVQQLLITTLWLSGKSQSIPEILSDVKELFQTDIENGKARSHLNKLCSTGIVVAMPPDQFKLAESSLQKYEGDIKEAQENEKAVEELFVKLLSVHCPGLEARETWLHFNKHFLAPFIREVGANAYKLLSDGSFNLHPSRFERFLKPYPVEIHDAFTDLVAEFLDPKNLHIRSYILRSLNAYFFIEASSLREDTLEALIRFTGSRPTFNVFVDTNFLFGILGLIPVGDDTGRSLMGLSGRLSGKVTVKFYVLPTTVDEARRKLIMTKQKLVGLRVVPNIADAALKMKLDGLQHKFFEESRKRGLLSAEDYFEPYISDLTAVMRGVGIELFNEDVDSYKTRQDVLDDIVSQLNIEERRYKKRAKNYERLEHDMVLWHCVKDKRPARIESPLEAKYWIATVDYRMLGFDKFKKRASKKSVPNSIPICLYPTTLIQMLQFWVPRTPEFEGAMLDTMRAPFLYKGFDPGAEKVTLDILKALSRFQNIGDLPTNTVSSILVNSALRQKMSIATEIEAKVNLVREALIEQQRKSEVQLKEVTGKLKATEMELQAESAERKARERQLLDRDADLDDLRRKLQELETTAVTEKGELTKKISDLEDAARARNQQHENRMQRRSFVARCVIAPLLLLVAVALGISLVLWRFTGFGFWWLISGTIVIALAVEAELIEWHGSRNSAVKDSTLFSRFQKSRKLVLGFLGAILASLVAALLYEKLK